MATYLAPRNPAATRPTPPRYKLALLTWAGAHAVITLILVVLGPAMAIGITREPAAWSTLRRDVVAEGRSSSSFTP